MSGDIKMNILSGFHEGWFELKMAQFDSVKLEIDFVYGATQPMQYVCQLVDKELEQ